jgi:hypothetical protein
MRQAVQDPVPAHERQTRLLQRMLRRETRVRAFPLQHNEDADSASFLVFCAKKSPDYKFLRGKMRNNF